MAEGKAISVLVLGNAVVWLVVSVAASLLAVRYVANRISEDNDGGGVLEATPYQKDLRFFAIAALLVLATVLCATSVAKASTGVMACAVLGMGYVAILSSALIDYKLRLIPNVIPLALAVGRVIVFIGEWLVAGQFVEYLLSSSLGALACAVVLLAAGRIAKGGIGGGDVKLVVAVGFACGLYSVMYAMAASLVICLVVVGILMARKAVSRKSSLPFAPFLYVGFTLATTLGLY